MRLLAMDTSTSAITVAVHDGDEVIASRHALDARRHAELLGPLLRETLEAAETTPAQITTVAVGTGPGPFTGLRVGVVTAQAFAHARGVPVHGVCSLDALAARAALEHEGELLVATDARRREVYWARYACEGGSITPLTRPAVDRPADLPEQVRALPTAGRGPLLYPELLPHGLGVLDVDAGPLATLAGQRLAEGVDMPTEPLYLRRPDAAEPKPPKSVTPPQLQRRRADPDGAATQQ